MKKIEFFYLALAITTLTLSCSEDDQPFKSQSFCEIGNTGKVVASCNELSSKDGSPITIATNINLLYSPDYSKISNYDLSEGVPGRLMNDYSYILQGNSVIDKDGKALYGDFKFNDKGYVSHLVDYENYSEPSVTHVTYDIAYNAEDRMSKITYNYMDANEKPLRVQVFDLLWEDGLLKAVKFDNNGEVQTTTYEYGNQTNVHRQPSASYFNDLNLLSLATIRPFLIAGYFGKGPDRFEVATHSPESYVAKDRIHSVDLDEEGKIIALHEEYNGGTHVDYTFTYDDIAVR